MSLIYRLSTITILAAAIAGNQGGCFSPTYELDSRDSWEVIPLWYSKTRHPGPINSSQSLSSESHYSVKSAHKPFLSTIPSLFKLQDLISDGGKIDNEKLHRANLHSWGAECASHFVALSDPSCIVHNLCVKRILPYSPSDLPSGVFVRQCFRISHGQFEAHPRQYPH
jgi:hypothetical protein